jgi:hypothetical protein
MANFTVLWEQEDANMIDVITLVMRSINKEAREKQEQRMIIHVPVSTYTN